MTLFSFKLYCKNTDLFSTPARLKPNNVILTKKEQDNPSGCPALPLKYIRV